VAAAVVSAVEDALSPFGVHIAQTPIFPAQIVALIEHARGVAGHR
jgi:carbon-monoxide dehydrogenase large subunit